MTASSQGEAGWAIEDAQATFDDEAGQVQLIIDLYVSAIGAGHWAAVYWTNFQVTTLAII
jgi:hypothetical protein